MIVSLPMFSFLQWVASLQYSDVAIRYDDAVPWYDASTNDGYAAASPARTSSGGSERGPVSERGPGGGCGPGGDGECGPGGDGGTGRYVHLTPLSFHFS